ncbi:MAG: hypothetical protein ACJ763_15150 [Bdellovibrionia bacterium]
MKLMKKAAGLAVLSIMAVACGKGMSGTYSITQSIQGGYFSSQCANTQLNLSLSESGGNVNGSGSNSCFSSETLTGTNDGSGHLNNVTLTLVTASQQSQSGYGYGYGSGYNNGYYNGYNNYGNQTSMTCTYTGTLYYSNNQLSGSLYLQQNNSQYSSYSSSCPSTVTLNGGITG